MTQTCSRCGAHLAGPLVGGGLCPVCVLRESVESPGDDEPAASALPRAFGRYELVEEIGRGGMGVVYRARQHALGRDVALKLLLAGPYSSERDLRRFQREAEAAAALQHPNIIAIHDYGECDGQSYYAMDLVDGPNLAQICRDRALGSVAAARLVQQIAGAVDYAHRSGVLHRDIKPSNVFVGSDGRPRIGDFGLAKRLDDPGATVTGIMMGSPSYTSPEQADGRAAASTIASDVYGLGALLFHLLTGRAPFLAATTGDTLRLVREADPPPPRLLNSGVHRDLETICLTCLEKETARRYPDAASVERDLERFLNHQPIEARPPGPLRRAAVLCQRYRTAVAATATVIFVSLAAVVAVIWALMQKQAALERSLAAERGQHEARGQAGRFANFMTGDFGLMVQRYVGSALLRQLAEQAVEYYERLPEETRTLEARKRYAGALEQLAGVRLSADGDLAAYLEFTSRALAVWEGIIQESPGDVDAAVLLIWARWRYASVSGNPGMRDRAWREDMIRQVRELHERDATSLPVRGCLGWMLCQQGVFLSRNRATVQDALATVMEGRALITGIENAQGLTLDDENHLVRTVQGSLSMLASVQLATGDAAAAIKTQEDCLRRFTAALEADPGNLILRALAAEAARKLCYIVVGVSFRRTWEAEAIAREHYRVLRNADPQNLEWMKGIAEGHRWSPGWYEFIGDYSAARRAWRTYDEHLQPVIARDEGSVTWSNYAVVPLAIAELSVELGDVDEAERQLAEAQPRIARNLAALSPDEAAAERVRFAQRIAVLAALEPRLTRGPQLMEEARIQLSGALARQPAHLEWQQRDAIMRAIDGIVRLRRGLDRAGLEQLQAAVADMPPLGVWLQMRYAPLRRLALRSLAEALAASGRGEECQGVLQQLLDEDANARRGYPDALERDEFLAVDQIGAATLIDLGSADRRARRDAWLTSASALIAAAEARGAWQSVSDREAKARLAALVGPQPESSP